MKCFPSDNGEKRNDQITTTATTRSSMPHLSPTTSTSTDDFRRLDSAFRSQNVSDMSAGSSSQTPSRTHLRSPTKKTNNLRVFTLSELKTATKNFNQLLMIGESGVRCVYMARIYSSEDSRTKIDVAIKQLGKRGLQRESVICSHTILASTRDSIALSVLVPSPFFLPDVSSESATTSLRGHVDDNKSCNEAMQRSDDITMDTVVSGKRRIMLPAPMDIDRKTDDSSTSQDQPCTIKTNDRGAIFWEEAP